MQSEIQGTVAPSRPEATERMELELALDLQEPTGENFDSCLRNAVEVVGGEVLFDMPADGSVEDASRIAAIRLPGREGEMIVFAVLDKDEQQIRIAERDEVGERFHGFAQAFVGVLERIRDDLSLRGREPSASLAS